MKKLVPAILVIIALMFSLSLNAQDSKSCDSQTVKNSEVECTSKTYSTVLKVEGKCGMCKSKIETAALSVKGVKSAEYNLEKKELTVKHEKDACMKTVQKEISLKGYDTQDYKTTAEAYNALPACCHYKE